MSGKFNAVYFKLQGEFAITSALYKEHLPEISRRSAVIMTYDLFEAIPLWNKLRPYVASYVHRTVLAKNNHIANYTSKLEQAFDAALYVSSVPFWGRDTSVNNSTTGFRELRVGDKFGLLVNYRLKISCSLEQPSDSLGYVLCPEPHYSWWDLFSMCTPSLKKDEFGDLLNHGLKIDKVICEYVRQNPLIYP